MNNINTNNTTNSEAMELQAGEFCQQCPNHCPVSNLKCGKGRSFFGVEKQGDAEADYHGGEKNHGQHGGRDRQGGRYDHGAKGERNEHSARGTRHEENAQGTGHEHGAHRENFDPDSLYGLMRGCGHFLYHKNGQGMGNSQERILSILLEKDSMTQKKLQEILGIQPGSISEILAKLEDKNLISRQKDEEDKRRSILMLTEEGKTFASQNKNTSSGKQLFSSLTEEEQKTLKGLLKKLRDNWNEQ